MLLPGKYRRGILTEQKKQCAFLKKENCMFNRKMNVERRAATPLGIDSTAP
jgi:hypothetical protein